jgi:hypothetical protein
VTLLEPAEATLLDEAAAADEVDIAPERPLPVMIPPPPISRVVTGASDAAAEAELDAEDATAEEVLRREEAMEEETVRMELAEEVGTAALEEEG